MASMKDVAAIAGVSVSTVSRVINNAIPVGARTRELVEQAIGEVNYRPNLLASGLRSRSGNLIGLAVPEIGHQSFDTFIKYIEEYARANKYGLILGDIQNDADGEADFIDQLIRRNVDGIIFIRVSDESRALEMLNTTTIPYVVLDRGASTATAPTVVMDNHQAGRLAAQHLIALGHRDVACVTGPLNVSLCRDRLDGFTQTLSAAGLRLLRDDIHESDFRFESGVTLVPGLLERVPPVTALWAQNDLMAIGIMAGLKDHGLSVPRDFSVIGVDDIVSCRMLRPQLTTVRQPFREMSRAAVELLLRESALGERISEKIEIPTELVVRQSTAPPRDVGSERQPVLSTVETLTSVAEEVR